MHLRAGSLAFAAAVLAGCATAPATVDLPPLGTWEERTAVLGELTDWQFKGRIAVKTGDEGFNGKFDWAQRGDDFEARVSGPLGVGTVRIAGSGRSVVLTDKDGTATELADAETELRGRYGWTIPVASLRYWALGIPDPRAPAVVVVGGDGRLERLEQDGWEVRIARYADGGGQPMPRVLTATRPESRVRMVIDRWIFPGR